MKKLLALFLALLLALSMGAVAFADDPVDPKAEEHPFPELQNDTPVMGHTYKAYQIFTGTLGPDGQLGDIRWGDGVNIGSCGESGSLLYNLFRDTTFGEGNNNLFRPIEDCSDEQEALEIILDIISSWGDNSDYAEAFAKDLYASLKGEGTVVTDSTTVQPGYYLIVDEDGRPKSLGEEEVYNLSILQTTDGHLTIRPKIDMPVIEKKVKDKADSNGVETDWQDSADYDIGDEVPFKITCKLGRISDFKSYMLQITDLPSEGLTFKEGSAVITVDGKEVPVKFSDSDPNMEYVFSEAYVPNAFAGPTATWTNTDIKPGEDEYFHDYAVITVEFICTLNEEAVIGAKGNLNKAYVKFSNNPNKTPSTTGETPFDKVRVFTYETDINKVDENNEPLAGAEFTLLKKIAPTGEYKTVEENVPATEVKKNNETVSYTAAFKGLDDGDYRLIETQTPSGYNTISPVDIHITAEHETLSDDPELIKLTTDKGTVVFDEGKIDVPVINQSGSVLPETGGIGTTIFYVVGAVLVVGAAVILFAKKKVEE